MHCVRDGANIGGCSHELVGGGYGHHGSIGIHEFRELPGGKHSGGQFGLCPAHACAVQISCALPGLNVCRGVHAGEHDLPAQAELTAHRSGEMPH